MENLRKNINKPPMHHKPWGASNAVRPTVARKPLIMAQPEKKRSSSVQVRNTILSKNKKFNELMGKFSTENELKLY